MKKAVVLLFKFCMCFFIMFTLVGFTLSGNANKSGRKIDLAGNIPISGQRSLVKSIDVFLIENESIEVNFNSNMGKISISIYDEGGCIVFQNNTDTYSGLQIVINISSYEKGEYWIELTNSKDEYLSGFFEI